MPERRPECMSLLDLVRRSAGPAPWAEGDNIPWHDPGFSERMLEIHLSQAHDMASRRSAETGLFSDRPHACLTEGAWDPATRTATVRHFVVDAATGGVERHAQTFRAYTDAEYRAALAGQGFEEARFFSSLGGREGGRAEGDFIAIAAGKA